MVIGTLTSSGSCVAKAGRYANTTATTSGSIMQAWIDEAEQYLCDYSHYDWVANYSSLTSNGKIILGMTASSIVAQNIVGYDITGYFTGEAVTVLNVLQNQINRGLELLNSDNVKTYLAAT